MTENEAIEILKEMKRQSKIILENPTTFYDSKSIVGGCKTMENHIKTYETSIKALEEIQQYRVVGTVEQCREAVERQRGKKIIFNSEEDREYEDYICPHCKDILQQRRKGATGVIIYKFKHCPNCGQAIDRVWERC